jgi:protoporphyrinogen/coproporphyrinogen III oxidase
VQNSNAVSADPDILVVGAGLSGLATARALRRRGADFAVIEAGARPGGVIRSGRVAGRLLEWGPQRARLTPGLSQLIRELRAEAELIVAPPDLPLFIYRDGTMRAAPFSWKGLLRTDLFGARAKLRIMLEPFTPRGGDDESVGRYFRRRFGRDAYVHLLGPLFGGLYASDPDQMLARHSLDPLLAQMNAGRSLLLTALRRSAAAAGRIPACSFRNGMQTLTDAMHASLSDRVALNERVTAVRRAADGFVVETTVTARHCRHIVLTADAPASADLLAHLDHAAARRVRSLRYNRFAIVHLSAALALRGMGCQVSLAERFATRGVTFNASLFARDDVYTAFLGGANDPNFVDRDDAEIAEIARGEFRTITGGEAGVLCVSRATIPAWDRSWAALDDFRSPAGVFFCANWESRAGIPGRFARAEQVARLVTEAN